MIPSLQDLPQEVLYQVLLYLPLDSVLAFEQVCNRFRDTSGPVVWRQLCKNSFQHWHTTHEFAKRLVLPVEQTNWKQLYAQRHKRRNQVQQGIDSILAQQSDRTAKIQDIVSLGWDAKDTLLHHCRIGDGQDDVLARRWYSRLVLGCLHRSISIEQWLKLDGFAEENGSLERALSAFDLFVAQEVDGNLSDVPAMLDAIAKDFEAKHPDCAQLAFQKKATVLAGYVQEHNLMGIDDDVDAHYHDLQNNFIRNALKHTHHPSLPLISVAIYCCIAQRLGLNARPCCFPFHVLAVIKSTDQDDVYLDPFRGPEEIKLSELKSKLESLSISPENHAKVLNAASTAEVVTRCARNIITAIQTIPQGHNGAQGSISPDSAFYGALWVLLLTSTTQGERHSVTQYAAYLPVVVNHMQTQFPSGGLFQYGSLPVSHHSLRVLCYRSPLPAIALFRLLVILKFHARMLHVT